MRCVQHRIPVRLHILSLFSMKHGVMPWQVSGRSCAKVINTDVKNAVVKLALVPPGLVMGQAYTFSIQAHVSPSLPSVLQLHVHAQNTTLCSSRVAGCRQKDLLVLGGGNATSVWGAVTVDFVSPVNSTVIYLSQAQVGLLWLDDATLVEQTAR